VQAYSSKGSVQFCGFENPVKYSLKVHEAEAGSTSVDSHNPSLSPPLLCPWDGQCHHMQPIFQIKTRLYQSWRLKNTK